MVALSGPGWRLAPCLAQLETEADQLAPARSKVYDGSIGDRAHQSRQSDHNVDNGWVDALDLTDDPPDFDARKIAERIRVGRDKRVLYVIAFNDARGRPEMFSSYKTSEHPAYTWRPYSGANPHTSHMHVSVRDGQRNDTSLWLQEDDMPTIDEVRKVIREELARMLDAPLGNYDPIKGDGSKPVSLEAALHRVHVRSIKQAAEHEEIVKRLP